MTQLNWVIPASPSASTSKIQSSFKSSPDQNNIKSQFLSRDPHNDTPVTPGLQSTGPVAHGVGGHRVLGPRHPTRLGSSPCGRQGWGMLLPPGFREGLVNLFSPRCNGAGQEGREIQKELNCGACVEKRAELFSYCFWFVITRLWFTSWGTTVLTAPTAPDKCKQRYQIVGVSTTIQIIHIPLASILDVRVND